jgi:hypothetical protein
LEAIMQGMYCSLRELRNASDRPPVCAAWRILSSDVANVCSSAWKRWTQRSQFTGIPRRPSQTLTNVAACEIAFDVKLCNSTP